MLYDIVHIPLLILGLVGFLLSLYIYNKKHKKKSLICPLRARCDEVIHSKFGSFLGIPVEVLGLGYYGIIALSHIVLLFIPTLGTEGVVFLLALLSAFAGLFSLYLVAIQAFVLHKWCTWCLLSAGISLTILFLTITSLPFDLAGVLTEHRRVVTIFHLLGMALGLGTATITDLFFFRFLKKLRINEEEADTMHMLSNVIWIGLAIVVLSGIGLFIPESERLLASGKFMVKMIGVAVLIVNGFVLNIAIAPRLMHISYGEAHHHKPGELHIIRRSAFALGAISITSWYFIFVLGALRGVTFHFDILFLIYAVLLGGAILGSQVFEYHFKITHEKN
jgi:uncharacterized membrane protein